MSPVSKKISDKCTLHQYASGATENKNEIGNAKRCTLAQELRHYKLNGIV